MAENRASGSVRSSPLISDSRRSRYRNVLGCVYTRGRRHRHISERVEPGPQRLHQMRALLPVLRQEPRDGAGGLVAPGADEISELDQQGFHLHGR